MLRSLATALCGLIAAGALSACANGSGAPTEPTPQGTTPYAVNLSVYPVGATWVVPNTPLSVTFERVVQDTRCPHQLPCATPGRAIVELTVRENGAPVREKFTMSAVDDLGQPWHDVTEIAGYRFQLTTLTPVPSNAQPDPSWPRYSANFRITR